jgi:hypothetical protein
MLTGEVEVPELRGAAGQRDVEARQVAAPTAPPAGMRIGQ